MEHIWTVLWLVSGGQTLCFSTARLSLCTVLAVTATAKVAASTSAVLYWGEQNNTLLQAFCGITNQSTRTCPDSRFSRYCRAASRSCQFLLKRQRTRYSSSTPDSSEASFASVADSGSGGARSPGQPGGGGPDQATLKAL